MINREPWIGKKEIVKLVENKIRDENLKMWDTRFRFFMTLGGALIVILGIIIPLWRTDTSRKENREATQEAIQEMEDKFARLAGTQLREPDVICIYNGDVFRGGTLTFVQYEMQEFLIKNVGDGPAENVVIRLYVDTDEYIPVRGISGKWDEENISDESDFGQVFVSYLFFGLGSRLIPQDSQTFGIQIDKEIRAKAMLKILFGHEPRRIPFTLVVQKKE